MLKWILMILMMETVEYNDDDAKDNNNDTNDNNYNDNIKHIHTL